MSDMVLIWVYNHLGERANAIVASDLEMDERLFQSYTIKFSMPAEDQKAMHLAPDVLLIVNGERFFITKIEKSREGPETNVIVTAEASWMKLADIKRPNSFLIDSWSVARGLALILSGTGWSIDVVSSDTTERSFEATDATVLDLIWQWAKVCGCEVAFDIRNSRMTMLSTIGANPGMGFRYGRNLTQIKRTEEAPKITKLYVYGRNDLSIEALTGGVQYIEDYSWFIAQGMTEEFARQWHNKEDVYRDDSFLEDAPLYAAAQIRLATLSQPQVSYSLSVVDLSVLTGLNESDYHIGDTCPVADSILDIDITARVSRTLRHPADHSEDTIELTVGDILLPDPSVSNARSNTTMSWEMFESRNWIGDRHVRAGSTILNRIGLRAIEGAEWIVGYKVTGVGVGTGTVTVTPVDDETLEPLWPAKTFTVADGEQFNWDFTYGKKEVPSGDHALVIRAISSGPGIGLDLEPYETALWVHARGTTRQNVVLDNSIRFDYNGAIQQWIVPDDASEIMMELHGGGSVQGTSTPSLGGKVVAKRAVSGGSTFDIVVGGEGQYGGSSGPGGWPNGGNGSTSSGAPHGSGGGGSSDIRPAGTGLASAFIVAGAAGGMGDGATYAGGVGGFYQGGTGQSGGNNPRPGHGATQYAGGTGESTALDGTFGEGADGNGGNSAFSYPGGGGGGGWYGGEAAGEPFGPGFSNSPGGGGGGSGWADSSCYDLEFEDGENNGHGYIIISWETPPE